MDIGEVWANYTYSYVNVALGDSHRYEFTTWPSNYLHKPSTQEDIEVAEGDTMATYTTKNLYRGLVKFYA
jgi:hypothetical protein